jgi:hypothetical protein
VREICRALDAERKAAEGDPSESVRRYLDMIRLANSTCRGGLAIDDLAVDAIEQGGLRGIAKELPGLNESGLTMLCETLPQLLAAREPIELGLKREAYFSRTSFGWIGRLMAWLEVDAFSSQATLQAMQLLRSRSLTWSRLILTEAAIRRRALAEHSFPDTLSDLVPKYLAEVPLDPFGTGPIIYRRTADGYLLYSVGSDGIDDGGQRARKDAVRGVVGDMFFDASDELPSGSEDASPDAMDAGQQSADSEDLSEPAK